MVEPKQPDPVKDFTAELPSLDKIVIEEFVALIPKHISKDIWDKRIAPVLHAYFNVKESIPKGSNVPDKKVGLYG